MRVITVARKPLVGTVAATTLSHGCGGINVDASRVGVEEITQTRNKGGRKYARKYDGSGENLKVDGAKTTTQGRFPANLILTDTPGVLGVFPETVTGALRKNHTTEPSSKNNSMFAGGGVFEHRGYDASRGSASRFFKVIPCE